MQQQHSFGSSNKIAITTIQAQRPSHLRRRSRSARRTPAPSRPTGFVLWTGLRIESQERIASESAAAGDKDKSGIITECGKQLRCSRSDAVVERFCLRGVVEYEAVPGVIAAEYVKIGVLSAVLNVCKRRRCRGNWKRLWTHVGSIWMQGLMEGIHSRLKRSVSETYDRDASNTKKSCLAVDDTKKIQASCSIRQKYRNACQSTEVFPGLILARESVQMCPRARYGLLQNKQSSERGIKIGTEGKFGEVCNCRDCDQREHDMASFCVYS